MRLEPWVLKFQISTALTGQGRDIICLFPRMFRNAAKPKWMFGSAYRGDRWGMEALKGVAYEKVQRWDPSVASHKCIE